MNIRTFTPQHQMTNYEPIPGIIPQISQMASYPTPVQQPFVQHNPLVYFKNRTGEDIFNGHLKLRDQQYKYHKKKWIQD